MDVLNTGVIYTRQEAGFPVPVQEEALTEQARFAVQLRRRQ